MSDLKTIIAEIREDVGKGASRRLRRAGKIPAIMYGGDKDPVSLTLDHETVLHQSEKEAFYASVLDVKVGDDVQQAVLRDMHRHPFKPRILHIDLMRISAEESIRMSVPIHFVGGEESPAGKAAGVIIQHQITEVEIEALPRDLPEYLTVDLSAMDDGDVVMLSDIQLPEGVEIHALSVSAKNDATVASTVRIKEDQGTGAAAAAEAEALAADEFGEVEIGEEEAEGEGEGEEGAAEGEEESSEKED